jgi:hypothetical protein
MAISAPPAHPKCDHTTAALRRPHAATTIQPRTPLHHQDRPAGICSSYTPLFPFSSYSDPDRCPGSAGRSQRPLRPTPIGKKDGIETNDPTSSTPIPTILGGTPDARMRSKRTGHGPQVSLCTTSHDVQDLIPQNHITLWRRPRRPVTKQTPYFSRTPTTPLTLSDHKNTSPAAARKF